ncbi:MAG: outer membrane beta-barrel protein [Acidobacteriota bacterium]
MGRFIFLAILVVASSAVGFAQSDDYSKVEVYGGYSHNRVDTGIDDSDPELSDIVNEREGFNGFNASVTGNITRYVGLKFDVAGHFKKKSFGFGGSSLDLDSSVFNVLGGVQFKDNAKEGNFKPFAHALVGAARARNKGTFNGACIAIVPSPCPNFNESDTGLAGVIGGGIDIRLNNRVAIRAVQLDYNPTRVFDATQHNFRIGAGIVFH